ncbi:hypothetical protein VQ056_09805 [Paenibacillus sp. JTLBN-2024]
MAFEKECAGIESKFWAKLTSVSVKYPVVVTVIIVILMIPALLTSAQKLSFDQLKELGDGYPSTKGFSLVAEHFSRGQALPTSVVIEDDKAMDNNEALGVIDKLTDKLKAIDGVKTVASVTQPQSKPIDEFYISSQSETVTDGISASKKAWIKSKAAWIRSRANWLRRIRRAPTSW